MRVRRSRKVGDREIGVSGTKDSYVTKPRYAISRKDTGRPSARTGGKGSGVVGVLLLGVFDGRLYGHSHMVSGHMNHGITKGAS
jgi:hypothetical protein